MYNYKKPINKVGYTLPVALSRPRDTTATNIISALMLNQSTLNEIVSICKPAANSAEFQIHYRAVIIRAIKGNAEFIITVPTTFYNFPQEVTAATIDYDLTEVAEIAEKAKPLSQVLAGKYAEALTIANTLRTAGATVTVYESNSGSIHRHPSDFGFSSTDYDKNPEHPGVIYRNKQADNHVQTDSVLYIPYIGQPKIVTTETRIVNVTPALDGGIEGTYCEVPTITFIKQDTDTLSDIFAGLLGTLDASSSEYIAVKSMITDIDFPMLHELKLNYSAIPTAPNLLAVLASNITPKSYAYKKSVYTPHVVSRKPVTPVYDDPNDDYYDADYLASYYHK